ncbi:hypothetical protein BRD00_06560 [Halobacteriales archaeon QS_8_69_26]|nr:MAG: hypothetical protein BRD00_06560 [Halobacteriales archaeon QS_8_69_26]
MTVRARASDMARADLTALVVSGTANSGRAVVETVAEAGGTAGFTYNESGEAADELLADLPGEGHEAWQCDVTDADRTRDVVDAAFDHLGEIDAVVYTVGVIAPSAVDETDPEDWAWHIDANVTGAFNVVNAAGPHLADQGGGAVVALSAAQGVLDNAELAAYDASKRGLEAFIQETARDLGDHGVRANVVAPGYIRDPDALSEEDRRDLVDQQTIDRITSPQDVADACLSLCSDDAAAITGAVVPVDGGLSL